MEWKSYLVLLAAYTLFVALPAYFGCVNGYHEAEDNPRSGAFGGAFRATLRSLVIVTVVSAVLLFFGSLGGAPGRFWMTVLALVIGLPAGLAGSGLVAFAAGIFAYWGAARGPGWGGVAAVLGAPLGLVAMKILLSLRSAGFEE